MLRDTPEPRLVHEFLSFAARRHPDAVALVEPTRSVAYGDLDALANRVAHVFCSRGVRPGDRVLLAMENGIELVACYFGAMKAGAVAVPLPPGPRSDRLARAVPDATPAACVVDATTARDAATADALRGVPARFVCVPGGRRGPDLAAAPVTFDSLLAAAEGQRSVPPDVCPIDIDLAAIIYTSGSTGAPKGVMLTHLNIRANTDSIVEYLELTAEDRVMCVLPFYYVYGLSLLHTHMRVGGAVVIDNRFAFPNVVLQAMQEHRVTGFAGVPSTFALLLHRSNLPEMTFPALRYVTQAGGSMPPARIQEWCSRGAAAALYVMYGATEASARLTYLHPRDLPRKLGSIGRPIPNVEILVVRDDGVPAGSGEVGELVARGTNISPGYWNDTEETAAKFGPLGYRTGDLGYADEDGFLYLVGRRNDMIKVGAHRVGAKEIEDVLHELAGVHEAVVIGVPDDLLGEAPVAFVSQAAPIGEPEVLAFCRTRLAPHKVPVRVVVTGELPKLATGKIDRAALRAELLRANPG
jgi:long-chain acyl-CoA synthetase